MKNYIYSVMCVALLGYALGGCNKEEVTVTPYKQAKESREATMPAAKQMADTHAEEGGGLVWVLPDGWKEDPTPRPMREATLIAAEGEDGAQVIVTRLGGSYGDFSANVNRWRGQVGLEPLADASTVKPELMETPAGQVKLLKMEGADKGQLVAMLEQGESTWFFRLTGGKAAVAANEAKLRGMIGGLKASGGEKAKN